LKAIAPGDAASQLICRVASVLGCECLRSAMPPTLAFKLLDRKATNLESQAHANPRSLNLKTCKPQYPENHNRPATNKHVQRSINQSINKSINPSINQSVGESSNQSIKQFINPSINQRTNQSICQ
jgi:hypothetical protein